MLPITDNRTDYEKRLYDIMLSDFFIWNEEVYRRIETTKEADIRYIGEITIEDVNDILEAAEDEMRTV